MLRTGVLKDGKSNTGGKFLIMDGHSLGYRAFALPLELQTKKGLHKCSPRLYADVAAVAGDESPDYLLSHLTTLRRLFVTRFIASIRLQGKNSEEMTEQIPFIKRNTTSF